MKKIILDAEGIGRALRDMAQEILPAKVSAEDLALVGIRTGGAFLVRRLQALLESAAGRAIPTGIIDINLYRDDWTRAAPKPVVGKTELAFSIDDRRLVLVDDVLFTGRTVRAALDALIDYGRPARIELAVLVDRGHRELPIRADYVGLAAATSREERVNVYLSEMGGVDAAAVEGP